MKQSCNCCREKPAKNYSDKLLINTSTYLANILLQNYLLICFCDVCESDGADEEASDEKTNR